MALDIIFLSYDEPLADKHFLLLQDMYPHVKRIHGVEGIRAAHYEAARLSTTSNFFVVDGDCEIIPEVADDVFLFKPDQWHRQYLHLWNSIVPTNGLVYGYGGIKLFPKEAFALQNEGSYVDFSTGATNGMVVMNPDRHVSITQFNGNAFVAWRSGFREAAKLTRVCKNFKQKLLDLSSGFTDDDLKQWDEAKARLAYWTMITTDAPFSEDAMLGAREGTKYAEQHPDLTIINNFEWLKEQYAISHR